MRFFLLVWFFVLPATAGTKKCGHTGSIEERIVECATFKEQFALVYSDEKGREVYKDLKSGLIWSDRISNDFNQYGSQKACSEGFEISELSHLKWRLPTLKEFEEGTKNGIKAILPNMNHGYWTSTPFKIKNRRRRVIMIGSYIWDAQEEKHDSGGLKDSASVRCVTK